MLKRLTLLSVLFVQATFAGEEVLWETLKQGMGQHNALSAPAQLVLKSAEALKQVNHRYAIGDDLDFSQNQLVVIDWGQQTSGGYFIKVNDVIESEEGIRVLATYHSPGSGCMTTQALTQPFVVLKVASKKPISVVASFVVKDCI